MSDYNDPWAWTQQMPSQQMSNTLPQTVQPMQPQGQPGGTAPLGLAGNMTKSLEGVALNSTIDGVMKTPSANPIAGGIQGALSGNYGGAAGGVAGATLGNALLPGIGGMAGSAIGNQLGSTVGKGK